MLAACLIENTLSASEDNVAAPPMQGRDTGRGTCGGSRPASRRSERGRGRREDLNILLRTFCELFFFSLQEVRGSILILVVGFVWVVLGVERQRVLFEGSVVVWPNTRGVLSADSHINHVHSTPHFLYPTGVCNETLRNIPMNWRGTVTLRLQQVWAVAWSMFTRTLYKKNNQEPYHQKNFLTNPRLFLYNLCSFTILYKTCRCEIAFKKSPFSLSPILCPLQSCWLRGSSDIWLLIWYRIKKLTSRWHSDICYLHYHDTRTFFSSEKSC